MKKLFLSLVMLLATVSFAQAYNVNFDWDGIGTDTTLKEYQYFQLNQYSPITTIQSISSGDFSETFTLLVPAGYYPGLSTPQSFDSDATPDRIFIELSLEGNAFDTNNIYFTSGSARMYDEVAGETIAKFDLVESLATKLQGSLQGTGTIADPKLAMMINLGFRFKNEDFNSNYWGPKEDYYTNNLMLLSFAGGSLFQTGLDVSGDNFLVSWNFNGAQMQFAAVPEPSTILLLGSGFLGVALFGRRKFSKKG